MSPAKWWLAPEIIISSATTFLATDYFLYRQNHWLVKSTVWRRVLRSNNGAATKPFETDTKLKTP